MRKELIIISAVAATGTVLAIADNTINGKSHYCGSPSNEGCKAGDIVALPAQYSGWFCDFDKNIIRWKDKAICSYIGYKRDGR